MTQSENNKPSQIEQTHASNSQYDLTLQKKGNLGNILANEHKDKQPAMRGFDPKFQDIVDYIVKITHEIWEERGLGRLYEYYGTNMRIHTSDGGLYGRDKVIEASIQALAAIPDRRLYADEVIWTGNDDTGYYSSHRLVHEGHNWGHTQYGPPSGRKVSYRAIADCKVVEGVIVEEWLVRDELAFVTQMGFDAKELACKMAHAQQDFGLNLEVLAEVDRLRGQLPPEPAAPWGSAEFDIESFVRASIHEVWNWRLLNRVKDYYAENYVGEPASGRRLYGRNQFVTYALSLLSPFPDLSVSVDHCCALRDDADTYRAATRWTMRGTHSGPGIYGEPSGNQIQILGVTHHLVKNGRIVREWTIFDEFALLKQIYAP